MGSRDRDCGLGNKTGVRGQGLGSGDQDWDQGTRTQIRGPRSGSGNRDWGLGTEIRIRGWGLGLGDRDWAQGTKTRIRGQGPGLGDRNQHQVTGTGVREQGPGSGDRDQGWHTSDQALECSVTGQPGPPQGPSPSPACPLGLPASLEGTQRGQDILPGHVPAATSPVSPQKLVNENMDTLVQLRSSSGQPEQMAALLPRLTCEPGGDLGTLSHVAGDTDTHVSPLSPFLLQRLKTS